MDNKKILLIIVLIAIVGAIIFLESIKAKPLEQETTEIKTETANERVLEKEKNFQKAKEIVSPAGYINTDKITISELIGKKVVLVDFWTYSCINCQRTTPFLNAWYEKYGNNGLEIIGIHTPEFEFEKEYENVKTAVQKFGIKYPVVLDNDYATWTAYRNRYWPRKYLIDIDGFIVFDHIGEGAYEETEKKIQEALEERANVLKLDGQISSEITMPESAEKTDETKILSPEIYFGALRNGFFAGEQGKTGLQELPYPTEAKTNTLYLVGKWNIQEEFAESASENAKIVFRYRAQKVFIVASAEQETKITVLKDGKPLSGTDKGKDITLEAGSTAAIKDSQLYRLVEDTEYGEHILEIIVEKPGLKAFTFTFG